MHMCTRSSGPALAVSVDCKSAFHLMAQGYAYVMMIFYPIGVPMLYAYLLFFKYGREMRLLRSLELRRVALIEDVRAANELTAAHADVKSRTNGLWSATVLAEARQGGSQRSLTRQRSSLQRIQTERASLSRSGAAASRRDLHAAGDTAAIIAKATEADSAVARLQAEETKLREQLPQVVQKLVLGYELRVFYFELVECGRKLLIVCVPVFFSGVAQLVCASCGARIVLVLSCAP